jgi:hypothetical protein
MFIGNVVISCNGYCLQTMDFLLIRQTNYVKINTDKFPLMLLNRHFINTTRNYGMFQNFNSGSQITLIPEY